MGWRYSGRITGVGNIPPNVDLALLVVFKGVYDIEKSSMYASMTLGLQYLCGQFKEGWSYLSHS